MSLELPFIFNALKHHLGYVRCFIEKTPPATPLPELRRLLLPVGAAQFDFYTGQLPPDAIIAEVQELLRQQSIFSLAAYKRWLGAQQGYGLVQLSDASLWVLRLGNQADRWVHLHPGRHARYTIRLKAPLLKQAIVLCILQLEVNAVSPAVLNAIRQELLLPPVALHQPLNNLINLVQMIRGE